VNATALAFPVIGLTIGFLSGGDLLTTLLLGFVPRTPFDR